MLGEYTNGLYRSFAYAGTPTKPRHTVHHYLCEKDSTNLSFLLSAYGNQCELCPATELELDI